MQPLEKTHAKTILQGFHLLPYGAGCDVQLVRGELEAQMARRGFECAQRVQWRQQIGHGPANYAGIGAETAWIGGRAPGGGCNSFSGLRAGAAWTYIPPMDISLLDRVKIQAQVLVPLVKALQAELGEERANTIVRKTLGDLYRKYGKKWWSAQVSNDVGKNMASHFDLYAAGGDFKWDVIKQTADAFEANVTECGYARFYKAIGVPELGFLLTCSADHPLVEGFGGDVQFTRTQTIMQGASHCDFRYALKRSAKPHASDVAM